ncbi:MAG: glycogen/starch/alpha-glucan phosphorylase [Candidatus Caldarchaeum sp.]
MKIVSITPEIALDDFPVYAGGLGVLESDKFYAAAASKMSYTVLTFFYPGGYVEYEPVDDGFAARPQKVLAMNLQAERDIFIDSEFLGEKIVIRPYSKTLGSAKVVFFHVLEPMKAARAVERLYIYDAQDSRELAAIILAKASAAYIRTVIGLDDIRYIDLQESLSSLITYLLPELGGKIRFVVHTIAPWANFGVNPAVVKKDIQNSDLEKYGSSLYYLSMDKAAKVFAVSAKHEKLVKQVSSSYAEKITHVTNGVNLDRWTHPEIARLLSSEKQVTMQSLADARNKMKKQFLEVLRAWKTSVDLDDDVFLVAWPRRLTKYKRPYFAERLIIDLVRKDDVFFVLGGKAHPFDGDGLYFMSRFRKLAKEYNNVVYLHDYDVAKAKLILSSVDLLLFTPFPGWEACGTSFMKAGVNGVPTLSSRDGGAVESIVDGYNGWLFGQELEHLINIYTDHDKTSQIDERDYSDMLQKFHDIYDVFTKKPVTYQQVSFNAFQTMRTRFDIRRALHEYYGSSQ